LRASSPAKTLRSRRAGATVFEYGLVAAIVGIGAVCALATLGGTGVVAMIEATYAAVVSVI
jgi:hypothetical protein